jgi:hypothetical protein
MATSPDGQLFQLEHSRRVSGRRYGGGYRIYRVKDDGNFEPCAAPNIPSSFPQNRERACEKFTAWAESMGYEAHVNELATPEDKEDMP